MNNFLLRWYLCFVSWRRKTGLMNPGPFDDRPASAMSGANNSSHATYKKAMRPPELLLILSQKLPLLEDDTPTADSKRNPVLLVKPDVTRALHDVLKNLKELKILIDKHVHPHSNNLPEKLPLLEDDTPTADSKRNPVLLVKPDVTRALHDVLKNLKELKILIDKHVHPHSNNLPEEIMDVEHLWHYNDQEAQKHSEHSSSSSSSNASSSSGTANNNNPDFLSNLDNIADHRLYRFVKWCKSLPLFKNISIDDEKALLINAWCELLLFSCCFRSMSSPGKIRVSLGKSLSLDQARELGLGAFVERMLNFTEHLRKLRVDQYEYVAMKVILLLTSDASYLKESEKVRNSQKKVLQALQHYTLAHYPEIPSKFGELLLRIPELQRTCQVGKEMLSVKNKEGEVPSFNLFMELLRGDH